MEFAVLAVSGLVAVLVIWVVPNALILMNNRVSGKEKAIWVFAVLFVSWLSWILFLFVAPVMDERR